MHKKQILIIVLYLLIMSACSPFTSLPRHKKIEAPYEAFYSTPYDNVKLLDKVIFPSCNQILKSDHRPAIPESCIKEARQLLKEKQSQIKIFYQMCNALNKPYGLVGTLRLAECFETATRLSKASELLAITTQCDQMGSSNKYYRPKDILRWDCLEDQITQVISKNENIELEPPTHWERFKSMNSCQKLTVGSFFGVAIGSAAYFIIVESTFGYGHSLVSILLAGGVAVLTEKTCGFLNSESNHNDDNESAILSNQ